MTTKALFSYNDGIYFDCEGHSDYVSTMGWNDCCVSVSNLCIMLINYIDSYGYEPEICQDGHVRIVLDEVDDCIMEVFKTVEKQFCWLAERYSEYLKVY